MPYDSNGIFSLNVGYLAVAGQVIQPSQHNPPLEDIALAGLSNVVVRDGRAAMTGNLKMGTFKVTGMADGTVATDGATKGQLDAAGVKTVQTFTANGTWTKPAGCKYVVVEAIGGGGGGGGTAAGIAGTAAAASGGASGFYGFTVPVSVAAIASGAVVIGALGAGGAAGANNGSQGGDTSIVLGATTYTWGGAPGGVGVTAVAGSRIPQLGGSPSGTNVLGSGNRQGANGFNDAGNFAQGGYGSDSPFGTGGAAPRQAGAGDGGGGAAGASNYGAGGAGAVSVGGAASRAGGNGAPGFMRVWEYY